jgi:hypothetical protein
MSQLISSDVKAPSRADNLFDLFLTFRIIWRVFRSDNKLPIMSVETNEQTPDQFHERALNDAMSLLVLARNRAAAKYRTKPKPYAFIATQASFLRTVVLRRFA